MESDSVVVDSDPVDHYLNLDRWPDVTADVSQPATEIFMVGFIIVNVVGLRHYNGTINGREVVGLVREPLNPYDENAIRVVNIRCDQVGHIERNAARILAPLIDSRLIRVEGIVPKALKKENRYKLSCQVHIFTSVDSFQEVKTEILNGGFQLIAENGAAFSLSDAMVVKERRDTGNKETTVDDLFKLLEEKTSKNGKLDAMEPPKDVISSELLLHQKEGLGWLVHRENSLDLPPFWEEKTGAYINVLTNYKTYERPEPFRCGIFADDMGLGKTLTLLSLVAFDKFLCHSPSTSIADLDVEKDSALGGGNVKKVKRGRPKKRPKTEHVDLAEVEGKSSSNRTFSSLCSKTTLIVCPPLVLSSWVSQIEEHVEKGKLTVYMYYGAERVKDASFLQKYDIVLTTYNTLAYEESHSESPMRNIEWRRVILDEAHLIKNINAQQSQAVTKLNSKRRWAVTGTPVQNHNYELLSLMTFLKLEPFSIKSYWNNYIAQPLACGGLKGITLLQVLMETICLRRTKEKILIGLPSKTVETHLVEFSEEEREVYDKMESQARIIIETYVSGSNVPKIHYYTSVLSVLVRLRQLCNDLALCPPHIREMLPSLEDVSNNPELMEKLLSVLQDGEDFDCPICMCPPKKMVITRCGHIFCHSCIMKIKKDSNVRCPMCRRTLSNEDLFTPKAKLGDAQIIKGSSSSFSSKVTALLKLLFESKKENPNGKSVIFSQFRQMLLLLEEPLKASGFTVSRLDGSMNAKQRAQVIEEFQAPGPDGPMILLASLRSCGAGINLTAASRVYMFEPWWNPAIEEQAMDRVHRIGQKQDIKVVRLIVRDTLEEKILQLQEQKKRLARRAFGGRGSSLDQREFTREDLITLIRW